MLTHKGIWAAIDGLAARHGYSASGLARRAGLDPTTFNKSKRVSHEGKPRWPSTESIAKLIEATGSTVMEFASLIGEQSNEGGPFRIPILGFADAAAGDCFDADGRPAGVGWDELLYPDLQDPAAYALEISGDGLAPIYRDGDVIIVSPAAAIRRGDRVVVRTASGALVARRLVRRTARRVDLQPLDGRQPSYAVERREVAWMSRILWVSQ